MKPTVDDVELSLRRYLSQTLAPVSPDQPWRIRLEREVIADDQRPVAVIESGRLSTPFRRSAPDQGPVIAAMPVTVTAYPETTGSAREAGRRARRLSQHLTDIATYGLDLGSAARFVGGPKRPRAGPDRMPIYDYEAVALEGPAADRKLPDGVEPIGWARVEDSSADAIQDVEDPRRWTVAWELRLSWDRGGRVSQVGAPVVVGLPYQDPPPPGAGPLY